MAMSVFRGLGEDVDDRLFRYILPMERKFVTPEMVRVGSRAVGAGNDRGRRHHGRRHVLFRNRSRQRRRPRPGCAALSARRWPISTPPDHKSFDEGFALVEAACRRIRRPSTGTPSIAPHAPYSTGLKVMERVAAWSEAHPDVPVQIHLAESQLEMDWARDNHGTSTGRGGAAVRAAASRADLRALPAS